MTGEPKAEGRRGPLAVLLVLFGLVLASAGPIALDGGDASAARLGHTGSAKRLVLARAASRELATPDEDDQGDPFVDPPPPRIVTAAGAARPAA